MSARSAVVTQRVFFALLPPVGLAREMQRIAQTCIADTSARRISLESLHMTLLFLGERNQNEIERAQSAAEAVRQAPFEIRLKHCEFRTRQAIVWLRGETDATLAALVENLRAGLQRAEVAFDPKPFLPHVTLARQVHSATPADCELSWPVYEFALMRSSPSPGGSRYQAIGRWPLRG